MPCAVFATGQSEEVVVTGDPSTQKGTRRRATVQNYIRFNDWPPDCAKPTPTLPGKPKWRSIAQTQLEMIKAVEIEKAERRAK